MLRTNQDLLNCLDQQHLDHAALAKVLNYIELHKNEPDVLNAPLDTRGNTALIIASDRSFTAVVEKLLTVEGLDVNKKNKEGHNALTLATKNNRAVIVPLLLGAKKINVNDKCGDGYTPLIQAAICGSTFMIEKLLANDNTNVNATDANNRTALIHACINYSPFVIDALLTKSTKKIDINHRDNSGKTALIHRAQWVDKVLFNALLNIQDVDVNVKDNNGCTALMVAVANNLTFTAHTQALIDKKANVNHVDNAGNTALHYATIIGSANLLLGVDGIQTNVKNKAGHNFLDAIIQRALISSTNDYWIGSNLELAAKLLLKINNDILSEYALLALKPHKNAVYNHLKSIKSELEILKLIFEDKNSILHRVFFYKNSVITKGRLGELHKRYLELTGPVIEEKKPAESSDEVKMKSGILLEKIVRELKTYYPSYKKILTLLFNAQPNEISADILTALKPKKDKLYEIIKNQSRNQYLSMLKNIIEGKDTTVFGKVFWFGHTDLGRGRLLVVYQDYQALIIEELNKLRTKEKLEQADITFINEFINSGAAFKLDDSLFSGVILKWIQLVAEKDVTSKGIEYLEQQYKPQLKVIAQSMDDKDQSALLKKLITDEVPINKPNNPAGFGATLLSVFSFSKNKTTDVNPTKAHDLHNTF